MMTCPLFQNNRIILLEDNTLISTITSLYLIHVSDSIPFTLNLYIAIQISPQSRNWIETSLRPNALLCPLFKHLKKKMAASPKF